MADSSTTTYSFTLPEVGASEDTWGEKLNANWTLADQLLDGTTAIAPNLSALKIGGVTVTSTPAELNVLDGITSTVDELNILDGVTATTTELNYVDGVTSAIQTQLDAKSDLSGATFTGAVDVTSTITANRGIGDTETASKTGTVTPDMDTYQNFVWTLTGNITLGNPSDEAVGQSGFFIFIHSGAARTVSLSSQWETAGAAGLTLSGASGAVDIVPYVVQSAGNILLGAPQLAFS
jgi:hypothetical protein